MQLTAIYLNIYLKKKTKKTFKTYTSLQKVCSTMLVTVSAQDRLGSEAKLTGGGVH